MTPNRRVTMASHIERRKFLATLLGGAAAWPLAARAQQPDREGLERLGWSEGRNVRIDYRFASAPNTERALPLAKELLALRIAGFFKGAETSRRKRAIATLSGLVGALTLARAVDDPALRRKSWSRRAVRLGRDYSVSLAQLRARPRRRCDGISAGAR